MPSPLILPKAILFDMDGTLTRPMLDFDAIRRDIGIGDHAILEAMSKMTAPERRRCEAILDRHEEHAAEHSQLNSGCKETVAYLHERGVRMALITRNSRRSVETVLKKHGLWFECIISRETCDPKPDPMPLHMACKSLRVEKRHAWMVGDGRYDIEAGLAAGVATIWVSHGQTRPFGVTPWRQVHDLIEMRQLLQSCA
jgi:HAD superfamily hydrolase (TIGR01549 family)